MSHSTPSTDILIWAGILFCMSQCALLSGLNLAIFSVSKLRLELDAAGGNPEVAKLLELRQDSNLTLSTIILANVTNNVLLTLLSESVLAGVGAFLFSTFVITYLGEIIPQAYFTRHTVRASARFRPLLKIYGTLLYPIAKPTAVFLNWWLGPEGIPLLRERDFRALINRHAGRSGADVGRVEATGAVNFLDLDDVPVVEEGEIVDPRSIIALPHDNGRPVLPPFERSQQDPFLQRIAASRKKWVIFVDERGEPTLVLNAHHFLRAAFLAPRPIQPETFWHRPIVVTDPRTRLGDVIVQMKVKAEHAEDDVIDQDLILVWLEQKRIITGADLLGRLLRGIVSASKSAAAPAKVTTENARRAAGA